MKVYEPVHVACDVCNERETYCFPFCRVPGEEKPRFIGVCKECRENLEYEVIPINTMLGERYICCPYTPLENPVVLDPETYDPRKPILTRYGKKLLEKPYEITVNGRKHTVAKQELSYSDVVELAEGSPDVLYSMMYFVKNGPHGIIAPGQSVKLEQDMHFSVYHTGNA